MPMKRSDAIKKFDGAIFPHLITFTDECNEALEVLLSTTKQVEEVVGTLTKLISDLEKYPKTSMSKGELQAYRLIFLMLTKEEE